MQLNSFYNKIYIIHYKPLTDRKEYLLNKLNQFNLSSLVEWVDQFDPKIYSKNVFNLHNRIMAANEAHCYCYEQQLKNNYQNILILEDDVDFENLNIISYLNKAAEDFIKLDGDIAFLGTCCGLTVRNINDSQLLYYDPNYGSRSTGAYIVNIRCTLKILECSKLNCHAVDRMLGVLIPIINIRCLWAGLPLKQGSETGKYKSSIVEIRDQKGNYPL